MIDLREEMGNLCDGITNSPIESMLLIALTAALSMLEITGPIEGHDVKARPSFRVGKYTIDIAIVCKSFPNIKIGVECDGHDFHERTREQAQHDKRRDRFLTSKGWKMLRFTGREIYANPYEAAYEIATIAGGDYVASMFEETRKAA